MAGLSRAFRFVPPALPAPALAAVRALVFLLARLPLLALVYSATEGELGANPVEAIGVKH